MSLHAEVISETARLEELAPAWDALAVAAALPFCAPGWLLPWWRSAAPASARLHTVAAFEAQRLVALAPFFADDDALVPLGAGANTRVEPVAVAGQEAEAAAAVAPALGQAGAAFLRLPGIPETSPWPELLAEAWPGGKAWLHEDERMAAPLVELPETFEEWFGSRSSRFRKQVRQYERTLAERGAKLKLGAGDGAIERFAALHRARWADRGTTFLDERVEAAVATAARELPPERLRLFTIDTSEGAVAATLFVAAGGEVGSWLGGFDAAWGDLTPQLLLGVEAIRDAIGRGDSRIDLGAGIVEYKQRLATADETLRWVTLVPPGPRQLLTRLRMTPGRARLAVSRRLSAEQKRRVKRLLRRSS